MEICTQCDKYYAIARHQSAASMHEFDKDPLCCSLYCTRIPFVWVIEHMVEGVNSHTKGENCYFFLTN